MQMKLSNLVTDSHGIMAVNKISFHGSDGWMKKWEIKMEFNRKKQFGMKIIYCKWHDNLAFILSDFNSEIEWNCAERVENDSENDERNERSHRIFENVDNESEPAKWSCPLWVLSTQHQIRIACTQSQTHIHTTIADKCGYTFMFCECEHMYLLI